MLTDYIHQALEQATYELIEDDEPYYAQVAALPGVWATGRSLEECRRNLLAAVEDWLLFSIAKGLPIPPLGGIAITLPQTLSTVTQSSKHHPRRVGICCIKG